MSIFANAVLNRQNALAIDHSAGSYFSFVEASISLAGFIYSVCYGVVPVLRQ